MEHALDRYLAAADTADVDKAAFEAFFIGCISAKFDMKLDEREWDDAITKALAYGAEKYAA